MTTESGSAPPSPTRTDPADSTLKPAKETIVTTAAKGRSFAGDWLPGPIACGLLILWLVGTLLFAFLGAPGYAFGKVTRCPFSENPNAPALGAEVIGKPPSDATLNAKLGISRGVAIASTSWPSGPGAPDHATVQVKSSALRKAGGASVIRPEQVVSAIAEIDSGTTVLRVCIDSKSDRFAHGQFNGFVSILTADPAKPLTVREQLSIQSAYVLAFWPLIFVIVPLALAVASKKLSLQTKPARWLILFSGAGAFLATYRANALSNTTWGGLEDVGSLIAATFTATTGVVATLAAATSQGTSDA